MTNKFLTESELKTLQRCYTMIKQNYDMLTQCEDDEYTLNEDLMNIADMYNRLKFYKRRLIYVLF